MDVAPAIRVIYQGADSQVGRKPLQYLDRHGKPITGPRDIEPGRSGGQGPFQTSRDISEIVIHGEPKPKVAEFRRCCMLSVAFPRSIEQWPRPQARTNWCPGSRRTSRFSSSTLRVARTWRGGQAGADDQLVDAGGLVVELAEERSFLVGECQLGGVADGGLVGGGVDLADERAELLEDVVDGFDQPGAVADQAMAAAAGQAVDGAGDGEDLAVLLHRVVRRWRATRSAGRPRPRPRRGINRR